MGDLVKVGQRLLPPVERKPDTWTCLVCGPVEPLLLPNGRYVERTCACQRKAKKEAAEKAEREEKLRAMAERTYGGWLGKEWIEPHVYQELAARRFEQYDPERKEYYQRLMTLYNKETDIARKEARKKEIDDLVVARKTWRNALEKAKVFADNPQGVLLLYGGSGLGKTHLLTSISNALRLRSVSVSSSFVTAPKFFMAFYDKMNHDHDEWNLVMQAISTPLLIIDDLDKASARPFKQEVFFQIIDDRITARRPIGISTNNMEGLASYIGDHAYSRLMDGCIPVKVSGKDYRSTRVVR